MCKLTFDEREGERAPGICAFSSPEDETDGLPGRTRVTPLVKCCEDYNIPQKCRSERLEVNTLCRYTLMLRTAVSDTSGAQSFNSVEHLHALFMQGAIHTKACSRLLRIGHLHI